MSSESDAELFITQSNYSSKYLTDTIAETDFVLSDILDLESDEAEKIPSPANFNLHLDMFSDISDSELIQATQEAEERHCRFQKPMQSSDLESMATGGMSKKTENKSRWAINVFNAWQSERVKQATLDSSVEPFPDELLEMSNENLNNALSFFVAEVPNKEGNEYRPNTVYELITSIQHFLRNNGRCVRFLDDDEFTGMRRILDAKMKSLSRQGLGISTRQAEIISEEQEMNMWQAGVLGQDNPETLLDTLVFQLGLHFALRAGQEHRQLRYGKLGQISVKSDTNGTKYLEYREDISKTNAGGLLHRKVEQKVTRAYENKECPEKCPVRIYEKYISLR